MRRRNLLNLGLLLLVIVLGSIVYFEPGKAPPPQAQRVLGVDADAVARIRIERQDRQAVAMVRRDGRWWLTRPVTAPVSEYRASSVLRLTRSNSLGHFAAAGRDLALYGLDRPRVTVTFNDDTTLAFGNNTPLDNRRYVLFGKTVHLVTDTVYYQLIGAYTTFIDNRLLPENSRISALSLPALSLSRQEEHWQVEPRPDDYSADQATRLTDAWTHASALAVKPYDNTPGETIEVQLQHSEEPLRFLLTARAPEVILARPDLGIQYHLADVAAAELFELAAAE